MTVYCDVAECIYNDLATEKCKYKYSLHLSSRGVCMCFNACKPRDMDVSTFEKTFGHLLSWSDAEKIVGHQLSFYNYHDCNTYHECLVEKVKEAGLYE